MIALAACVWLAAHPTLTEQPHALAFEMDADPVVLPMRLKDGRIELDVTIDGKGPVPFVLDTGAHGSVLDLAYAREIGLPLGEEVRVGSPGGGGIAGKRVSFGRLAIGGLRVKDVPAVAFAPWPFPASPGMARGVLSPYGLAGLLVEIDYPNQRVVLRRGALPEPDGREVFGWDRARGLPEVPVVVAGKTIAAHLDSGASAGLSLPGKWATKLPLASPLVEIGRARLVDRELVVKGATLDGEVRIGRFVLDKPEVDFVDIGVETANVGPSILRQLTLTLDPAHDRLRLAGPADGKLVAAARPKRYGILFKPDAPLEVSDVLPGRPADKAGLRAGDRVVKINGKPAAEMSADDRARAMKESPLMLVVARGEGTVELKLTLD
jgi:hypothetical protein